MTHNDDVREDLEASIWSFENVVKPYIKKWLNLKKVWTIERQQTEIEEVLDKFAGIDYQGLTYSGHLVTLSSRCQWYPKKKYLLDHYPYNSFTVRRTRIINGKRYTKVGFFNKLNAILNDYSYPVYHSEAYLSERYKKHSLLSLALCKTKDLIFYVRDGIEKQDYDKRFTPERGLAEFNAVYFANSSFQESHHYPLFPHTLKIYNPNPFMTIKDLFNKLKMEEFF